MRNRFVDRCYRCGEPVAPGGGFFERVPRKDRIPGSTWPWRVQHVACCEAARRAKAEKATEEPKR